MLRAFVRVVNLNLAHKSVAKSDWILCTLRDFFISVAGIQFHAHFLSVQTKSGRFSGFGKEQEKSAYEKSFGANSFYMWCVCIRWTIFLGNRLHTSGNSSFSVTSTQCRTSALTLDAFDAIFFTSVYYGSLPEESWVRFYSCRILFNSPIIPIYSPMLSYCCSMLYTLLWYCGFLSILLCAFFRFSFHIFIACFNSGDAYTLFCLFRIKNKSMCACVCVW